MTAVVDASVAAKWFLREPLHEEALKLLHARSELCAPDLLVIELTNIFWRKSTAGQMSLAQGLEGIAAITGSSIVLEPAAMLAGPALEIAAALQHPAYDCFYLACAERRDGFVVTADEHLCRAVAGGPYAALVRHLRDLPAA